MGSLGFNNSDLNKLTSDFSGGWQMRILLAKLLLAKPDLLLLDEPTNHLDLDSREALEEALIRYPGTIVVISHDRWFIDKVCNKIVSIEHGQFDIFDGTYSEHEAFLAQRAAQNADISEDSQESQNAKKRKRVEAAQQRSAIQKATKHLAERVKKCEATTADLEKKIAEIDKQLADPETYKESNKIKTLTMTKSTLQAELDQAFEDWMTAQ
ncbi:MAG: ABC-F family ATP-binding cassette domain-containing protein, partial [Proteobacteria bacterium]|nr:ABC-F family ATP-binding cassette domain-containing protein [Pseudomonadota bacterium]